jgi:hypothetical protein
MEKRATVAGFLMLSGCITLPFLAAAIISRGIFVPLQLGFLGETLPPLLNFKLGISVLCLFALGRKALFGVFCGLAAYCVINRSGSLSVDLIVEHVVYAIIALVLAALYLSAPITPKHQSIKVTSSMVLGLAALVGVLHAIILLPELGTYYALKISGMIALGELIGFFAIIIFGVAILRLERRLLRSA